MPADVTPRALRGLRIPPGLPVLAQKQPSGCPGTASLSPSDRRTVIVIAITAPALTRRSQGL